jgi:hypothetical protein
VKLAAPVTGRAVWACPLTAPATPPDRFVLGGVKAPFWLFEA